MNNIDKEKEKWNKQKSMGKIKFILINGILRWVIISIIYGILTIIFNPNPINLNTIGIVFRFITYAIIFCIVGIVYSSMLWNVKIKKCETN